MKSKYDKTDIDIITEAYEASTGWNGSIVVPAGYEDYYAPYITSVLKNTDGKVISRTVDGYPIVYTTATPRECLKIFERDELFDPNPEDRGEVIEDEDTYISISDYSDFQVMLYAVSR